MMWFLRAVLFLSLVLSGLHASVGSEGIDHHSAHRLHKHKNKRNHRATSEELHFDPKPFNKKIELSTPGKIHCKVSGGHAPTVQWFLNSADQLPEGLSSANGTLHVGSAEKRHVGNYTCRATDGNVTITAEIHLDVVVSPKVIEPLPDTEVHVGERQSVLLNCRAVGDPPPTTHWVRNLTILQQQDGVDVEGGVNASHARMVLLHNGSLLVRSARREDSDRYACTAGSAAGLARTELILTVHPEGYFAEGGSGSGSESGAGRAVLVAAGVAAGYMLLVLALMLYCRRRRRERRLRGEKIELEMAEGREKLVEEGEDKPKVNGAPNGKLPHDRDSGADTSEVSGVSRASRRGFDHLAVPRALLTEQVALGRGEFGEVSVARLDAAALKRARSLAAPAPASASASASAPRLRPVLVKALTSKDEAAGAEFRRQLELFGRVRHEGVARLLALCSDADPHLMILEYTDWGDLKTFLQATGAEQALSAQHQALLASQLARAAAALAAQRLTHRDIAARNCAISSALRLKLTMAGMSRGPDAAHYYKRHDQVIPLRWLPAEAALEGEYSAKSDAYMFAATVWEDQKHRADGAIRRAVTKDVAKVDIAIDELLLIYTKAELPFSKLNDNSVLERLKSGSLEWTVPDSMPDALGSILKRCWSASPAERPQFEAICTEVDAVLKDVTTEETPQENES